MRPAVFVWQFDRDYPGAEPDDRRLPISAVWVKTHAGSTWMGQVYAHPAAPRSRASVTHLAQTYRDQGLEFWPWWEPQGRDRDGEVARCVDVLKGIADAGLPPRLVFDLEVEPTPHFWKGTPGQVVELCDRIRAEVPEAELWLCHYQDTAIGLPQIAPAFAGFVTMDYWTDFGVTPEAQLWASAQRLGVYGKPVIYGLPGAAPAAEMARALAWVRDRRAQAVLWRRGTTTAEVWQTVAAQAAPPPTPPDVVLQYRIDRALECLTGDFTAAKGAIDQLLADLAATGEVPVVTGGLPPVLTTPAQRGLGEGSEAPVALPPSTLRQARARVARHLPHPWVVAGLGALVTALDAVSQHLLAGSLPIPDPAVRAALIALLPALVAALRARIPEEEAP